MLWSDAADAARALDFYRWSRGGGAVTLPGKVVRCTDCMLKGATAGGRSACHRAGGEVTQLDRRPADAEFQPLCGLTDRAEVVAGYIDLPQAVGIGFELRRRTERAFGVLMTDALCY